MSEKILIVEDEKHLADGLRFNLEAEGYKVKAVDTGEAALDLLLPEKRDAAAESFDLVVLDVMLPGKNGFEVAKELRVAGQFIPTLMLTAQGRPEDVLSGFAAGADDYLPKPFELSILIARIRGLLRRKHWLASAQADSSSQAEDSKARIKDTFTFDGKSVHFDTLELHVNGQAFPLTLMEANILRYLIEREGKVVSRKAMLEEVWGLHADTDTRAIDNFIVRLRRHIEDDPSRPKHLKTVRGVGYKFVAG